MKRKDTLEVFFEIIFATLVALFVAYMAQQMFS